MKKCPVCLSYFRCSEGSRFCSVKCVDIKLSSLNDIRALKKSSTNRDEYNRTVNNEYVAYKYVGTSKLIKKITSTY